MTYNVVLVHAVFGVIAVRAVHGSVTHTDDPGSLGTVLGSVGLLSQHTIHSSVTTNGIIFYTLLFRIHDFFLKEDLSFQRSGVRNVLNVIMSTLIST